MSTNTTTKTTARKLSGAALKTKREKMIRRAWALGLGILFLALAFIGLAGSFQHLKHLGILAGQDASHWWGTANLTPLSIDIMLVVASIQLRRKNITRTARLIARICSVAGLLFSLAGNVLVAWLTLPAGATALTVAYTLVWSAVPVASLLGATEMLTHTRPDGATVSRKPKTRKASAPARARHAAPKAATAEA